MNDYELLKFIEAFIVAINVENNDERKAFAIEPQIFAQIIKTGKEEGNLIANKIPLYPGIYEVNCPDFKKGLSLAQSLGLSINLTVDLLLHYLPDNV